MTDLPYIVAHETESRSGLFYLKFMRRGIAAGAFYRDQDANLCLWYEGQWTVTAVGMESYFVPHGWLVEAMIALSQKRKRPGAKDSIKAGANQRKDDARAPPIESPAVSRSVIVWCRKSLLVLAFGCPITFKDVQ